MAKPKQLTQDEVLAIQDEVRRRDQDRCLLDGKLGGEVHEMLQKSSSRPRSARVYQKKFMAVVCSQHHNDLHHTGQKRKINARLLTILRRRYSYKYTPDQLKKFLEKEGN